MGVKKHMLFFLFIFIKVAISLDFKFKCNVSDYMNKAAIKGEFVGDYYETTH